MRIAGCVILYNSGLECIDSVKTYLFQVERLYVIDNSEVINDLLIRELTCYEHVQYIWNKKNMGVGYALNIAANRAILDGFTHLLTMDDDTSVPSDLIYRMSSFLSVFNKKEEIGIVSGCHNKTKKNKTATFEYVLFVMTSGNLLNLGVFQKVGPFREDFFIDHIDHEYGLRLKNSKYKILVLNDIMLQHRLGKLKIDKIFNIKFVSHNPIRLYYFFRNGFFILQLFSFFTLKDYFIFSKILLKEMIKNVVLEDEKVIRARAMFKGIIDSFRMS